MKLEKGLLIERAAQLPDWAAAFEKEVIKQPLPFVKYKESVEKR